MVNDSSSTICAFSVECCIGPACKEVFCIEIVTFEETHQDLNACRRLVKHEINNFQGLYMTAPLYSCTGVDLCDNEFKIQENVFFLQNTEMWYHLTFN